MKKLLIYYGETLTEYLCMEKSYEMLWEIFRVYDDHFDL